MGKHSGSAQIPESGNRAGADGVALSTRHSLVARAAPLDAQLGRDLERIAVRREGVRFDGGARERLRPVRADGEALPGRWSRRGCAAGAPQAGNSSTTAPSGMKRRRGSGVRVRTRSPSICTSRILPRAPLTNPGRRIAPAAASSGSEAAASLVQRPAKRAREGGAGAGSARPGWEPWRSGLGCGRKVAEGYAVLERSEGGARQSPRQSALPVPAKVSSWSKIDEATNSHKAHRPLLRSPPLRASK
jgi:hypothetical protein